MNAAAAQARRCADAPGRRHRRAARRRGRVRRPPGRDDARGVESLDVLDDADEEVPDEAEPQPSVSTGGASFAGILEQVRALAGTPGARRHRGARAAARGPAARLAARDRRPRVPARRRRSGDPARRAGPRARARPPCPATPGSVVVVVGEQSDVDAVALLLAERLRLEPAAICAAGARAGGRARTGRVGVAKAATADELAAWRRRASPSARRSGSSRSRSDPRPPTAPTPPRSCAPAVRPRCGPSSTRAPRPPTPPRGWRRWAVPTGSTPSPCAACSTRRSRARSWTWAPRWCGSTASRRRPSRGPPPSARRWARPVPVEDAARRYVRAMHATGAHRRRRALGSG